MPTADPRSAPKKLTIRDVQTIRELRYQDGHSTREVARQVGCSPTFVATHAPGWPGKVSNDLVRDAFLRSGLSITEVARRLGWTYRRPEGESLNGYRVKRVLGIVPDHGRFARMIDAETCGLIAEAVGVAAWSVMPDDEQIAA